MKKALLVLALLIAAAVGHPRPRFEMIYQQYHDPGDHTFEVFHDRETGQEVVCVYGGMNVASCYLTGRNWK